MATNLGKIFDQLAKNSKALAVESMEKSMQKAYKLSIAEAQSCLKRYYDSYTPKYYKRTKSLWKAVKGSPPQHKTTGKTHEISFAIVYNSSFLNGIYTSNSWYHQAGGEWKSVAQHQTFNQNNGIPDSGWILENYLYGIHPRYVGTPETGISNNSVQDGRTTMDDMTKFFQQELPSKIEDIVNDAMEHAIFKFIQG